MSKAVSSITPFTLLDYPDQTACILWYAGCNMRCLYCYNPEIVLGKGKFTFPEIITFLKSRIGLLDAVVFSGGECLIHKEITTHIRTVKELGFLVKVDTNGSRPEILEYLMKEQLVDYVALDFKSDKVSSTYITQSDLFINFERSLQVLIHSKFNFEIRTTYHSDLLCEKQLAEMAAYLKNIGYTGIYYIQNFRNNVPTLGNLNHSINLIKPETIGASQLKVVIR